jgi:transglutaminase-like putative cysteine protease
VRYEVTIDPPPGVAGGDPAKIFPSGPGQEVKPTSANTAELIVTAVRAQNGPAAQPSSPPTEADRQPNNLVQSDHPLVVQMAQEAAGAEIDPVRVASSLERYVRTTVQNKNFTQALATAADVAQSREGDCTEHAVLLAALSRARGIPARVAIGLVYVESLQGFGYHMWSELYVNDTWVPFDGTLGQGGTGGAHLKLAHSSLSGGDAFSAFLPVAQLLGRLKIRVLEAE